MGVALGLAALTTVAAATSQDLLGDRPPSDPAAVQQALTGGYAAGLRGAALVALAGAAPTILLLPSSHPAPDPDTTTAPSRRSPA